jgi:uncharacterized protein
VAGTGRPDWLEAVEQEAKRYFEHDCAHGWDHVERVRALAVALAEREGGDIVVTEAAALLHDIGRQGPGESSSGHAAASAELAGPILQRVGCPTEKAETIVASIADHSYQEGRQPRCLEGRILQDADRLDAMGAVGIGRAFMRAGERRRSLASAAQHFHDKLLQLEDGMHTETAREMAVGRHGVLERFLRELEAERGH